MTWFGKYWQWLRRFTLPALLLTLMVVVWSIVMGVLVYRLLGIRLGSVNGRPATFTDEFLIFGVDGATLAICLHITAANRGKESRRKSSAWHWRGC